MPSVVLLDQENEGDVENAINRIGHFIRLFVGRLDDGVVV